MSPPNTIFHRKIGRRHYMPCEDRNRDLCIQDITKVLTMRSHKKVQIPYCFILLELKALHEKNKNTVPNIYIYIYPFTNAFSCLLKKKHLSTMLQPCTNLDFWQLYSALDVLLKCT